MYLCTRHFYVIGDIFEQPHQFCELLALDDKKVEVQKFTRCGSHFRNFFKFKILKEPLLVQKQTLNLQKALDLSYLEAEGQVCSLKNVT